MSKEKTMQTHRGADVCWLIAKRSGGIGSEVLTMDAGGEERLPIFSFEEEGEMFLSFGMLGAGWSLRVATVGELNSLLTGPYAGVESVALDPLPEMISRGAVGLVSASRERFLRHLVERVNLRESDFAISRTV